MPKQIDYFITGFFWFGILNENNCTKTIFFGEIEPKEDGSFSGKISDQYGEAEIVCSFSDSELIMVKQYIGAHTGYPSPIHYHLSNKNGLGYFGWFNLSKNEAPRSNGWATCALVPKDDIYKRQTV